jgi:hypothetical protein
LVTTPGEQDVIKLACRTKSTDWVIARGGFCKSCQSPAHFFDVGCRRARADVLMIVLPEHNELDIRQSRKKSLEQRVQAWIEGITIAMGFKQRMYVIVVLRSP